MTYRPLEQVSRFPPPLRIFRNRGFFFLIVSILLIHPSLVRAQGPSPVPNIFDTVSTPADSIHRLSLFVLTITALIFIVVFSLLIYAIVRFRHRPTDENHEPPQVYGSNQVELAWTVIPVLIVLVLFFATARVIQSVQDAVPPANAIQVTAVGHQFWWEFRYPALGIVTANELHVPVSDRSRPTPTFVKLLSADTNHSFWVPQLAGKTDLIPNRINSIWIDPHEPGMYVGQCAQYCGVAARQNASSCLCRFPRAIQAVGQRAETACSYVLTRSPTDDASSKQTACVNCHAIAGTIANGRFRSGPHSPHESPDHRFRRRAQHSRKSQTLDPPSRLHQTELPHARHEFKRQGSRCAYRLSGVLAMKPRVLVYVL